MLNGVKNYFADSLSEDVRKLLGSSNRMPGWEEPAPLPRPHSPGEQFTDKKKIRFSPKKNSSDTSYVSNASKEALNFTSGNGHSAVSSTVNYNINKKHEEVNNLKTEI